MFKLRLNRWSSGSPGTLRRRSGRSVHSRERFRRLKLELAAKQRQLQLLRERTSRAIETMKAEENERLAFALASLRRRLHVEKTAELRAQKRELERQFERRLGKVHEQQGHQRRAGVASWIGTDDEEQEKDEDDEKADDHPENVTEKVAEDQLRDEGKEQLDTLSRLQIHDFNDDDDNTADIESTIEKYLQNDAFLALASFKIPRSNVWSCRDKFRRHSPLEGNRSIMTTIEEEKEEYDWFEERRQLLHDNARLNAKVQELETVKQKLENELQEVRDQNELLEFRILELEEDPSVSSDQSSHHSTIDKGTNTEAKINRRDDCMLPITKKLLYPELCKYNEEKLNVVCEKLSEWADNKKIHQTEDITILMQATALLEFLKQQIYITPNIHENFVFDEKIHIQDASDKIVADNLNHANLSMSSSIDSASDGLDMISQGGETGYSSDESIDTEELCELNVNMGDFSTSNAIGSPDKLEFVTHSSPNFQILPADLFKSNDSAGTNSRKKISEMLQQIQTIQDELPRLMQRQANLDNMDEDAKLHKKFADESEMNPLSEQDVKLEIMLLVESEKRLQNAVAELMEKERAGLAKIANLEQERDKLHLEAKQLLQLIDNSSNNPTAVSANFQCSLQNPNPSLSPKCEIKNGDITTMITEEKTEILTDTELIYGTPYADPTIIGSSCRMCGTKPIMNSQIQKLLNENQVLQHFLNNKQIEMQNKKAEYDLKIEALKCDHEETMASQEERLSFMQQKERDLRQCLMETTQLKEKVEKQYRSTLEELQQERSKNSLQSTQRNQPTEHEIRDKVCYDSKCQEDVYENQTVLKTSSSLGICDRVHTLTALENHLNQLCHEAEGKSLTLASAVDDGELHISSDDNLMEKIHDMAREQARLKQRIFELEKKQTAYKETLQEADKIMADVEKGYKERIEELEQLEGKLRARIVQLEQSEKRLRQTVKHNNRNNEVGKFGELLDRLLETEAAEQRLNERIHDLQQKFQQQRQYIGSLEKEKRVLEEELQDQEELLHTINCMKRTEKEMCLRIEELQTSESALQETLHQADAILAEREGKLQDQLRIMEGELQQLRRANDHINISEADLKQLLAEAEEELARSSSVHRGSITDVTSNVTKDVDNETTLTLLQQIAGPACAVKLAEESNSVRIQQMADVVEMNGQLEIQVLQLQSTNEMLRERALQLESELLQQNVKTNSSNVTEETNLCLKLNLELLAKNCEIESLQEKLKLLETGNAAAELQTLSLHADEIKQLKEKIGSMSTCIENCNCCNCANCWPLLRDIESEVLVLDQLISGSCSPDCSSDEKDTCYLETMSSTSDSTNDLLNGKGLMEINSCPKLQSHRQSSKSAQNHNNEMKSTSKQLQNLQNQVAMLQDDLMHKRKQAEAKEDKIQSLQQKVEKLEHSLSAKEMELNNMQNNIRSLQRENSDFQEKIQKAELSEKVVQENLHRKKQDLKISTHQVQQLEQRLSHMGKQLKSSDELVEENQKLMHKIQELEAEMQKKKEAERKLHAENLHLHHKVEAQKERVSSLQIVKKEYKNLISKYDLLEKQKKIVDQAVVPLKNKISHLNQKCKEKEQFINHLTKQKQLMSSSSSTSSKSKPIPLFVKNENTENHEHGQLSVSPDMHLSLISSSDSSDRSTDSLNYHVSHKTLTPSARSRIPRYVALASPINSPRSSESKIPSHTEVPVEQPLHTEKPNQPFNLNSPRLKSSHKEVTTKKQSNQPVPPTPTDFQVTRQVGPDSILIAWIPPVIEHITSATAITGYQVFVNGLLNQKVRSPNRTKALLTSVDLSQPVEVTIRSIAESGLLSAPAKVVFNASNETAPSKHDTKIPSKRKCFIKSNYNPPKTNSSNPYLELKLKEGDIATTFGARQPNGFFYGEVNGQRGLIPAHVLDDSYHGIQNLQYAS